MIKPEQTTPCISNPHEKAIEKLEVNLNPNDTMSTEKFTHCIYDSPEVYIQTVQAALFCSAITVYIADCAPPTKHIHVVSKSCAGYLFNVNACMMYHMDHVIQLATVRTDLFSQFSWAAILP